MSEACHGHWNEAQSPTISEMAEGQVSVSERSRLSPSWEAGKINHTKDIDGTNVTTIKIIEKAQAFPGPSQTTGSLLMFQIIFDKNARFNNFDVFVRNQF